MSGPDIGPTEVQAVLEVLRGDQLSMGPRLDRFEERFAEYVGARHAVAVSSGTAGLHLSVLAAGIEAADLVLTTPFSFVASSNVILYERATPVFVDIDPSTFNVDVDLLAQAAEDLAAGAASARRWLPRSHREAPLGRLRAILAVDVFGQPVDVDAIGQIAEQRHLAVIQDACEAMGAEFRGRTVGTQADAAVFAFYPNKQMTTGEGGVITTDRADWADLFRSLRNQGRDSSREWLTHVRLGFNYRLDELSAALGLAQLERIDELLERRAQVAAWYTERLDQLEGVTPHQIAPTTTRMSWFVYVVRFPDEIDRDRVITALRDRGIPSRPYFNPIHLQPFYRQRFGYRPGDFPVTEAAARSTLALPFSGTMKADEVDLVCEALTEVLPTSWRASVRPGTP